MKSEPQQSTLPTAFLKWVSRFYSERTIQMEILNAESEGVAFRFSCLPTAISGWVGATNLNIAAHHEGECWDLLLDLDCVVKSDRGRYWCGLCEQGARPCFSKTEDLWHDHVFVPLARWISTALVPGHGIAFYRLGGVTEARLVYAPPHPENLVAFISAAPSEEY